MFRSLARRERRPLWSVVSFLLAAGLGLSLWAASQAKSGSVKDTTNEVRIIAQTDIAPMLQPRDLTAPIVGERATELGAQIERSILSDGPIDDVRIYSSVGRILFADDPSIVGTRPSYIRDLTSEVASGHARSIVRGGRLQTYVPIWLTPDGTVVVAELSQPYAPIAGAGSGEWQRLALIAGALLLVSLAMVVTTTRAMPRAVAEARGSQPMSARGSAASASSSPQRATPGDKPAYVQDGFRQVEERRQEAERRVQAAEQNLGGLQKQLNDALTKVKDLEGRLAVKDGERATNGSELRAMREELKDTSERLTKAELDNTALRERMTLRQREFDDLARKLQKLESAAPSEDLEPLKTKLAETERRNAEMARDIERLEAELENTQSSFHMTKLSEALREFDTPDEGETEEQQNKDKPATVTVRDRRRGTTPEKVR
jgi:hypothetical protein